MIEVSDRLVYWTAAHPAWRPNPVWPPEVGCVLYRHRDALVLIDPLVADWRSLDGEVARADAPVVVLLTAPWHLRSAPAVAERYGASVWASAAARARMETLTGSKRFRPESTRSRRAASTKGRSRSSSSPSGPWS